MSRPHITVWVKFFYNTSKWEMMVFHRPPDTGTSYRLTVPVPGNELGEEVPYYSLGRHFEKTKELKDKKETKAVTPGRVISA